MIRALCAGTLAALIVATLAAMAIGAEPTPGSTALPSEMLAGGDLRSEGEGPGLVGNPVLILLAVVALGLVTAGITVLLLRLTQRD